MKSLFLDCIIETQDKKQKLLNKIINIFLKYYDNINFEDDDYIENITFHLYSSKETTEEEERKRIIKMLEDKED